MDYLNVEPDYYTDPLPDHWTRGRSGRRIEFITRHHLMMVGNAWDARRVWLSRPASAHYVVGPDGKVGQVVNDSDTAWANADWDANCKTLAIEHSNCAVNDDWPINETTLKAGARLAAALCLYYGLGRPQHGKNIRDHREFTSTACPYHLAKGGRYDRMWMDEATRFYDELVAKKEGRTLPQHRPEPQGGTMTDFDQIPRRYQSRVPGSEVTMRPIDALLNVDSHAWQSLQLLKKIEEQNINILNRISKLEAK